MEEGWREQKVHGPNAEDAVLQFKSSDYPRGSYWSWVKGLPESWKKPAVTFHYYTEVELVRFTVSERHVTVPTPIANVPGETIMWPKGTGEILEENGAVMCQYTGGGNLKAMRQLKFPNE